MSRFYGLLCTYVSLGMYVCNVCQTTTFESLDVGSLFSHLRYISVVKFIYEGHRVKVKVTGLRERKGS